MIPAPRRRPPAIRRTGCLVALAFALLLPPLLGGCADYCPPESEDFLCRYVVSVRPPDFLRPDLNEGPEARRTDPRYVN